MHGPLNVKFVNAKQAQVLLLCVFERTWRRKKLVLHVVQGIPRKLYNSTCWYHLFWNGLSVLSMAEDTSLSHMYRDFALCLQFRTVSNCVLCLQFRTVSPISYCLRFRTVSPILHCFQLGTVSSVSHCVSNFVLSQISHCLQFHTVSPISCCLQFRTLSNFVLFLQFHTLSPISYCL